MIPFFQSTDLEFDHFLARGLPSVRSEATDILAPGQPQWPLTGVPASAVGPLQCVLHMAHSAIFKQGPTVLRLNVMPWQWLEAPRSSPALPVLISSFFPSAPATLASVLFLETYYHPFMSFGLCSNALWPNTYPHPLYAFLLLYRLYGTYHRGGPGFWEA